MNNTEFELLSKEEIFSYYEDVLKYSKELEVKIDELQSQVDNLEGDYDADPHAAQKLSNRNMMRVMKLGTQWVVINER